MIAAFCVGQPALEATVAVLAYCGLAGERAAETTAGPVSFQAAFLDALAALSSEAADAGAWVNAG